MMIFCKLFLVESTTSNEIVINSSCSRWNVIILFHFIFIFSAIQMYCCNYIKTKIVIEVYFLEKDMPMVDIWFLSFNRKALDRLIYFLSLWHFPSFPNNSQVPLKT